jgi:hypothetical protein
MQRRMVGNGESKRCKDEPRVCIKVVKILLGQVHSALAYRKKQSEISLKAMHSSKPGLFEDGFEYLPEGFLVTQRIVQGWAFR